MRTQLVRFRAFAFICALAALSFGAAASADPPSRVARLSYAAGAVSFSAAGQDDWSQAALNRPLTTGDRLWVAEDARAELQDSGTLIRLRGGTGISVLNLDDAGTQLQLTQGSLNLRVRRLAPDQVVEVDTPQLALTLRQSGDYRIAVEPDGSVTDVIVRSGQAEVSGPGAAYLINAQQRYRFRGGDLRDNEFLAAPRPDEFDSWASERDRAFERSASARYVSPDVIGYQDLDANGIWRVDPTYGNVWYPSQVGPDWAPYRDGHWSWIVPWGWTWVDDAPWGFAVSHYGRWAHLGQRWAWVPGPVRASAWYAPALVAFVGGDHFNLTIASGNVGGIGWFPLAPREIYRPSYVASRRYFENINRSNTVISTTVINNSYNMRDRDDHDYANRRIPGAVIAVPRSTFVNSQPVSGAAVRIAPELLGRAPLVAAPPLAPDQQRRGGAEPALRPPPPRSFERPVESRVRPPGRDNAPQRAPVPVAPVTGPQTQTQTQTPPQARPQPEPRLQPPPRIKPEPPQRPTAPEPKAAVAPVLVPRASVPPAAAPVPAPAPVARPPESHAPAAVSKPPAATPAPARGQVGPREERRAQAAAAADAKSREPEDGHDGPRRPEDRRKSSN